MGEIIQAVQTTNRFSKMVTQISDEKERVQKGRGELRSANEKPG